MEKRIQGIPAAPGCVLGVAVLLPFSTIENETNANATNSEGNVGTPESETQQLSDARRAYAVYLDEQFETATRNGRTDAAAIVDAYREFVSDDDVMNDVAEAIRSQACSAEKAIRDVFKTIIDEMTTIDDEYARQRIDDVRAFVADLTQFLRNGSFGESLSLEPNSILVGTDVRPTQITSIDPSLLAGIVTENGGRTSHLAILAQNLGIPVVVGVSDIRGKFRNNETVALDGYAGEIVLSPDSETVERYRKRREEERRTFALLETIQDVPCVTPDGRPFQLWANLSDPLEIKNAVRFGASGIGLLRTEFLFADARSIPGEEEQFRLYQKLATQFPGPAIIRTFDVGGDKPLDFLPLPREANPFLGWRACRLYADFPELIQPQLKAILRASACSDVRLMFPMVSSLEETERLLAILDETKADLRRRRLPFNERTPVGLMIETPAAATIVRDLAAFVDFFSIGTNDLTQYALAVDRGNAKVASLYDYRSPAVLRLIARIVRDARSEGKPVGLCGELAGDARLAPFLLGLGLDEWSMSPRRLPLVKQTLLQTTVAQAETVVRRVLAAKTIREVRSILENDDR